jgi:hypothetical protein
MARAARHLLVLTFLAGTLSAPASHAQAPDGLNSSGILPLPQKLDPSNTPPSNPSPATMTDPDFLRTLPRPPAQPASLYAPPPPPGPPLPDLEQPYFQQDPLVDPPNLGAIGWFADVDVGFLKPHLVNELVMPITFPDGTPVTVQVNASRLNWTASPRVEVGYRLPTGFGGIAFSYRNLASQGSDTVTGSDGPATLSSRLNANLADLDWVSNEYVVRPLWELRLRFGLRYLNVYFDSQANEPFAEAAAGSTISSQRTTDSTWALGPHAAVDIRRHLGFWGLAVVGFLDISDGWSRLSQNYFASSTTSASGLPQNAVFTTGTTSSAPVLTVRLGLNWQPTSYPAVRLFAGGQLDYWWNIGRNGQFVQTPYGYFFDSGIVLRGEWNF